MNRYKAIVFAALAIAACHKKDDPVVPSVNNEQVTHLKMSFKNVVDGAPLVLKTGVYTNAHGDTFSVNSYMYYISNITLTKTDGSIYYEPESYHLVVEGADQYKSFTIAGLPTGGYAAIKFLIGVDSARNVSGAQTGALDVINGMFWDWHQGYIMARMEGTSPQASLQNNLAFHIGGYAGPNSALQWVTLSFPQTVNVTKDNMPVITFTSDVAEWFKTPNIIDFTKTSFIAMESPTAAMIAHNYADMFRIESIQ